MLDVYGHLLQDSIVQVDLPEGDYVLSSNVTTTSCLGFGDESKLAETTIIHRRPPLGCPRNAAGATLLGHATRLSWVCAKCGCNAHNALCMRHGSAQPKVTMDFEHARAAYTGLIPILSVAYTEAMRDNYEEWITKWPALKQAMLLKSSDMDLIRPGRVDFMVKRECNHTLPSKARGIQMYSNLATQARFGPEFYCLQKAVGKVFMRKRLPGGVRVTFASGMNSVTLGEWMSNVLLDYDTPMFYERDGKNWDASMQYAHLRIKLAAYSFMSPEFLEFVKKSDDVRGTGRLPRGLFRYRVRSTTKSGQNDTTIGNSIVNLAIVLQVMREMGLRGAIIVAGDDVVVAIEGDFDADEFARRESACGINPEFRKFYRFEDVSFISGVWWRNGGTYVFTPKIGRLLARLNWTVNPPSMRQYESYRAAVAMGLLPTCLGLPIARALIDPWIGVSSSFELRSKKYITTRCHVEWDDTIMAQVASRYHITELDILRLEEVLRRYARAPVLLIDPTAEAVMRVDLADVDQRPFERYAG